MRLITSLKSKIYLTIIINYYEIKTIVVVKFKYLVLYRTFKYYFNIKSIFKI